MELRPHEANFVRLGRTDAVCYSDRADAEIWANVGEEIAVVLFDGDPAPQLLLFFLVPDERAGFMSRAH